MVNVFFLPFAGGNRFSYRQFQQIKTPVFEIIPLEYPGRGTRIGEPFCESIEDLVDELYDQVKDLLPKRDYAIYGHSMGGLLACLLTRKILKMNHEAPLHLFITGTPGPSANREKKRSTLSTCDFLEELRMLKGCPEEVLQNDELFNFIEPILRSDFKLTEDYVYQEEEKLSIPITVITGSNESITQEEILLWQHETSFKVDFRKMPGDHFFILKHPYEIIQIISKQILIRTKTPSLL